MAKIISIGEINRIARLLTAHKLRMSAWPLLVLIELSKYDGWQPLRTIVKAIDSKKYTGNSEHIYTPLQELGLVEFRKVAGIGSQFDNWQCKLSLTLHCVDSASYDADEVKQLLDIAKLYMAENRKTSPLLMLVLIAVKIRKITSSSEVMRFCYGSQAGKSSHQRILDELSKLGVVALIKTGEFQRAPVIIFEVES